MRQVPPVSRSDGASVPERQRAGKPQANAAIPKDSSNSCSQPGLAHNSARGRPRGQQHTTMEGLLPGSRPVMLRKRGSEMERSAVVQLPALVLGRDRRAGVG